MDSKANLPDRKPPANNKPVKLGSRATAARRRGRMVQRHPFCSRCQREVVDLRRLKKKPGITIVTERLSATVAWIDEQGQQHEALIATVHHVESLAEHKLKGKKKPHRHNNLQVHCVPCHQAVEEERRQRTASSPQKPR